MPNQLQGTTSTQRARYPQTQLVAPLSFCAREQTNTGCALSATMARPIVRSTYHVRLLVSALTAMPFAAKYCASVGTDRMIALDEISQFEPQKGLLATCWHCRCEFDPIDSGRKSCGRWQQSKRTIDKVVSPCSENPSQNRDRKPAVFTGGAACKIRTGNPHGINQWSAWAPFSRGAGSRCA